MAKSSKKKHDRQALAPRDVAPTGTESAAQASDATGEVPIPAPTPRWRRIVRQNLSADAVDRPALRLFVLACQAITIVFTWPLWKDRTGELPCLPMGLALPLDFGWLLLATLALALWRPAQGVLLHAVLLGVAMWSDQMRMQPEFISMAILLTGTLPSKFWLAICRVHLGTLWFYAGLHKLCSEPFLRYYAKAEFEKIFPFAAGNAVSMPALFIAVIELALALLLISTKTRRWAAYTGCIVHLGCFGVLVLKNWNEAVWFWNLALAASALAYFVQWRTPLNVVWRSFTLPTKAIVTALLISPFGYYFGVVDPYLAHCLYTMNTPNAWVLESKELFDEVDPANPQTESPKPASPASIPWKNSLSAKSLDALNVPFPPTIRLYDAWYRLAEHDPKALLVIRDPRWIAAERGMSERVLTGGGEFRDGKREGAWQSRLPSGTIEMTGEFRNGQRTGLWTMYAEDGKKSAEGTYVDDRMEGPWTFWGDDGRAIVVQYRNGNPIEQP